MSKPTTNATYLKTQGNECPYCSSKAINGSDRYESDGIWLTREVGCEDCGRIWKDYYELQGYVQEK